MTAFRRNRLKPALVVAFAAACSETTGPGAPAELSINTDALNMYRGATAGLTATVTDANGRSIPDAVVTWSASDSSVVDVSSAGLVTARRIGGAHVVASAAGLSDSVFVVVLLPAGGVAVSPAVLTVVPGGSLSPSALMGTPGLPIDVTRQVLWTIRDTTIARVVAGRITGKAVGTTYVVAEWDQSDSALVQVRQVVFRTVEPGGARYTCGLSVDSAAFCWGEARFGGLGTGTSDTTSNVPVGVSGSKKFAVLAVGEEMACGLTGSGKAYCWGVNYGGGLGIGAMVPYVREPTAVAGGHTFKALDVGYYNGCGLDLNGRAWCWGIQNNNDQLFEPVLVGGTVTFHSLVAGGYHRCGLAADSVAYCWGAGGFGTIGDDTTLDRDVPTRVAGSLKFTSLAAALSTTCGVTAAGMGYCWGENYWGELGDSTRIQRNAPVAVRGGLVFRALDAGSPTTCGVTVTFGAYCWGNNGGGQAGTGETSFFPYTTPQAVTGGHAFGQVSTRGTHTCGITTPPTTAYCWGLGSHGELGDSTDTVTTQPVPQRVAGQP